MPGPVDGAGKDAGKAEFLPEKAKGRIPLFSDLLQGLAGALADRLVRVLFCKALKFWEGFFGLRADTTECPGGMPSHQDLGIAGGLDERRYGFIRLRADVAERISGKYSHVNVLVPKGLDERRDGRFRLRTDVTERSGGIHSHVSDRRRALVERTLLERDANNVCFQVNPRSLFAGHGLAPVLWRHGGDTVAELSAHKGFSSRLPLALPTGTW